MKRNILLVSAVLLAGIFTVNEASYAWTAAEVGSAHRSKPNRENKYSANTGETTRVNKELSKYKMGTVPAVGSAHRSKVNRENKYSTDTGETTKVKKGLSTYKMGTGPVEPLKTQEPVIQTNTKAKK